MKQFSFKTLPLFIIGVFFLSAFMLKPAPADFSGKWKLNEGKSELGQFASFAIRGIETEQSADAINISRTAPSFEGTDVTTKERLTFDGKEAESSSFGDSKKKSVASWSEDGKMLTISYNLKMEFNGQSLDIKGKEVWALADEGKTLVVKNTGSSSFGEFETTSVYEK